MILVWSLLVKSCCVITFNYCLYVQALTEGKIYIIRSLTSVYMYVHVYDWHCLLPVPKEHLRATCKREAGATYSSPLKKYVFICSVAILLK